MSVKPGIFGPGGNGRELTVRLRAALTPNRWAVPPGKPAAASPARVVVVAALIGMLASGRLDAALDEQDAASPRPDYRVAT